jgi:hypothetical protein
MSNRAALSHVAQQNAAGIRHDNPDIARPPRTCPQCRRTGQSLLAVRRHHRLACRAAGGRITSAPRMLADQPRAPALIGSRPIRPGFGKHLDRTAFGIDCHQTETDQSAKPAHTRIPVASAPCRRHGKPHFVRRAHAVHSLKQQIEIEAELHFHDRQSPRLPVAQGDDIAAVYFALCGQGAKHRWRGDGRYPRGRRQDLTRREAIRR